MKQIAFLLLLLACLSACSKKAGRQPPAPTHLSGEELASTHCGSCHLFPAPDLLDKTSWERGVLPEMAYKLGMKDPIEKLGLLEPDEIANVLRAGTYPDGPVLTEEDWQKIVRYYIENAPDKPLPQDSVPPVRVGLPFFQVKPLAEKMTRMPMVSMVKIDEAAGRVYAGRREKNALEVYDRALKKIDSLPVGSPVSEVLNPDGKNLLALQMGVMEPNDRKKGKLTRIDDEKNETILIDSLQRPVHLAYSDLNADGVADYLICHYGNETGKLAWYDGKTLKEHLLKIQPGARNTIVQDLNADGRPDIAVLMCQARESISIWYNKGGGEFEEQIVLQFPPVYGSSYFSLADMNADGRPDILYTNGDNADYSFSEALPRSAHLPQRRAKSFHRKLFLPGIRRFQSARRRFRRRRRPRSGDDFLFPGPRPKTESWIFIL